ncbi:MAG: hypothetical protein RL199_940 [Pseudomonadota bacterium]|jgi:hypothetical protein
MRPSKRVVPRRTAVCRGEGVAERDGVEPAHVLGGTVRVFVTAVKSDGFDFMTAVHEFRRGRRERQSPVSVKVVVR